MILVVLWAVGTLLLGAPACIHWHRANRHATAVVWLREETERADRADAERLIYDATAARIELELTAVASHFRPSDGACSRVPGDFASSNVVIDGNFKVANPEDSIGHLVDLYPWIFSRLHEREVLRRILPEYCPKPPRVISRFQYEALSVGEQSEYIALARANGMRWVRRDA